MPTTKFSQQQWAECPRADTSLRCSRAAQDCQCRCEKHPWKNAVSHGLIRQLLRRALGGQCTGQEATQEGRPEGQGPRHGPGSRGQALLRSVILLVQSVASDIPHPGHMVPWAPYKPLHEQQDPSVHQSQLCSREARVYASKGKAGP